jgi:hypothetical protein
MRVEKLQTLDCREFDELVKYELGEECNFQQAAAEWGFGQNTYHRFNWYGKIEGNLTDLNPIDAFAYRLFDKGIFSKSMDVIVWNWW